MIKVEIKLIFEKNTNESFSEVCNKADIIYEMYKDSPAYTNIDKDVNIITHKVIITAQCLYE